MLQGTMIGDKIKKNLLDLQYTKYLQYHNTSIILLFTYFIGVIIAFMTKQVNYKDINQIYAVIIVTIAFVSIDVLYMLSFKDHLKNILSEIKKLNL